MQFRKEGYIARRIVYLVSHIRHADRTPAYGVRRLLKGQWDGDLIIKGARNRSQVGTLVKRTTLFAI